MMGGKYPVRCRIIENGERDASPILGYSDELEEPVFIFTSDLYGIDGEGSDDIVYNILRDLADNLKEMGIKTDVVPVKVGDREGWLWGLVIPMRYMIESVLNEILIEKKIRK